MNIKNLPKKIYLQIGEECDLPDEVDFRELHEVTWCEDRIEKTDVEYILEPLPEIRESLVFEILTNRFPDYNVPYCTEVAEEIVNLLNPEK